MRYTYNDAYNALLNGVLDFEGTQYEKAQHIKERIQSEGFNLDDTPTSDHHASIKSWLQGMALNIPHYDDDIKEVFGLDDKQVQNYWAFMAMRTRELVAASEAHLNKVLNK